MTPLQFFRAGLDWWDARQPDGTIVGSIWKNGCTFHVSLSAAHGLFAECIAYHATLGAAQRRLVRAYGKRFGI